MTQRWSSEADLAAIKKAKEDNDAITKPVATQAEPGTCSKANAWC